MIESELRERMHREAARMSGPSIRLDDVVARGRRRRVQEFAVAAGIAVVLVAGAVVGATWTSSPLHVVSDLDSSSSIDVQWSTTDLRAGLVEPGPDGFVRAGFFADRLHVEFSPDGQSWEPVDMGADGAVTALVASDDRWLLLTSRAGGVIHSAWWSEDGRSWSEVEWPAEIEGSLSHVIAWGGGFLAVPMDPTHTHWVSSDAVRWTPWQPEAWFESSEIQVVGTPGGLVGTPLVDQTDRRLVATSTDGVRWSEGFVELPADISSAPHNWSIHPVVRLEDRWVAIAQVETSDGPARMHAWTSIDGIGWTWSGATALGVDDTEPVMVMDYAVRDGALFVVPGVASGTVEQSGVVVSNGFVEPTSEVWATSDGVEWFQVLDADVAVADIEVRSSEDGLVGVWMPLPDDGNSGPVTTLSE